MMNEPSGSVENDDGIETITLEDDRKIKRKKTVKNSTNLNVKNFIYFINKYRLIVLLFFKAIWSIVHEFFANSYIVGLKYFSQRKRHWTERFVRNNIS